MPDSTPRQTDLLVWDIWIRVFHWTLVLAITVAAVTGFLLGVPWLRLHLVAGLGAAALIVMRIVWGIVGSTHARFADFVPRPQAVWAHLRGRDGRHLGHNPLGALMVLALFALVLILALSGIAMLGGAFRLGPLAADLDVAAGLGAREIHEILAFVLLGLVALHLGGVVVESRRTRENLARAMVTGRKPARAGDRPSRVVAARGGLAIAAIAVIGGALVTANAGLSARAVPGLPAMPLDPVVAEECSACHMVYHPSLRPASSWAAIMATLDDHFGEDASLDAQSTAEISDWLTAHAAENTETLPARLFAAAADAPVALPDLVIWKRLHAGLPDAVFTRRTVGSRSNCLACHGDAETGRFSPFAISIPEETPR